MNQPSFVTEALIQPFGTALANKMAIAHYRNGAWQPFEITDVGPLSLSPAAHVLHYGSTCFEGMKVHRWADGSVHAFRIDAHAARLAQSSEALCLPRVEPDMFTEMVSAAVRACEDLGTLTARLSLCSTHLDRNASQHRRRCRTLARGYLFRHPRTRGLIF